MTSATISSKAATGNVSGLGWPGANEMMPGFSISALMRRMAEKRMPRAAAEKRGSHVFEGIGLLAKPEVYPASGGHSRRPRHRTPRVRADHGSSIYGRHPACKLD